MNLLRNSLVGAILVVVFLLFIEWNKFQENQIVSLQPTAVPTPVASDLINDDIPESPTITTSDDDLPLAPTTTAVNLAPEELPTSVAVNSNDIVVKTDTLDIKIDPKGGDIVGLALVSHLNNLDEPDSEFVMLIDSPRHTYVAQSDLIGSNGTHRRNDAGKVERQVFTSARTHYEMKDGQDILNVDLSHTQQDGSEITKRFSFERGSYHVKIQYIVNNHADTPWKAAMYGRIKRDDFSQEVGGMFRLQPYLGAATTTPEDTFKKISFGDIRDKEMKFEMDGGWVAMVQHYFVSAWIPDSSTTNTFKLYHSNDRRFYLLQFTTPLYTVQPGETKTINSSFYAGPKIIKNLESISPGLDLTIDFGVLWFIAKPLFLGLDFIHNLVNNWGLAIILLTFMVKLVFLYPSAISYRSMAKMRKLMPLMQDLKERYGDDRQRMGVETMKLYKKEGVNPLGGCLPMLMQMPVFMALYWMIMESVELRHSEFLWIQDLSYQDPYFILPVIMGAIMFIQQKLNPPPQDPMQAKIFQFMPIGFTFILLFFPAALTLYMAVNTALSFLQQYLITKQIENAST